jgi:hypothetical protein
MRVRQASRGVWVVLSVPTAPVLCAPGAAGTPAHGRPAVRGSA